MVLSKLLRYILTFVKVLIMKCTDLQNFPEFWMNSVIKKGTICVVAFMLTS